MLQYRLYGGHSLPPGLEGFIKAGANIGSVIGQFAFGAYNHRISSCDPQDAIERCPLDLPWAENTTRRESADRDSPRDQVTPPTTSAGKQFVSTHPARTAPSDAWKTERTF